MSELEAARVRGLMNGVPTVQVPKWMWDEVLIVLGTFEAVCAAPHQDQSLKGRHLAAIRAAIDRKTPEKYLRAK